MSARRSIALAVAAVATAAGAALAVPAVAGAEPATTTAATQSTDSWVITVKRAENPTLQAERDRVMHDATREGMTATLFCTRAEAQCDDSFVVSGVAYRTLVTRFRYDAAIVSITPLDK